MDLDEDCEPEALGLLAVVLSEKAGQCLRVSTRERLRTV